MFVPLTKVLVCGLLAWPARRKPVMTGSRFGIVVPVWLITVPLPVLAPVWVEALVVIPVACPACGRLNVAWGRKQYCDDACRARAYRLRKRGPAVATVAVPVGRPRRPITVYECPACGPSANSAAIAGVSWRG